LLLLLLLLLLLQAPAALFELSALSNQLAGRQAGSAADCTQLLATNISAIS
jgi:hypothetical protein